MALLCALAATTATAASLPVVPGDLTATTLVGGTGAPTVFVWDDFNRVGNLDGSTSPSGATWLYQIGNWSMNGSVARSAVSNADANVMVNAGTVDASLVVTVTPAGNRRPGVIVNDDTQLDLLILYSNVSGGRLTLYKYFSSRVELARANSVGTGPFELRVTSNGTLITVFVNGVQRISYTLNAADACTAKHIGAGTVCTPNGYANTWFGLFADRDTSSTFEDFRVESV